MKSSAGSPRRRLLVSAVQDEWPGLLSALRAEISTLLPSDWTLSEQYQPDSPTAMGVAGAGWKASAGEMSCSSALRSDALTGLLNGLRRRWLRVTLAGSAGWTLVNGNAVFDTLIVDGPDARRYLLNIEERGDGRSKLTEELRFAQGDVTWCEVGWTVPAGLVGYPTALCAALMGLPDGADIAALPVLAVDLDEVDPDGYVEMPPAGQLNIVPRAGMIVSLIDDRQRVVARLREGEHAWRLVAELLSPSRTASS